VRLSTSVGGRPAGNNGGITCAKGIQFALSKKTGRTTNKSDRGIMQNESAVPCIGKSAITRGKGVNARRYHREVQRVHCRLLSAARKGGTASQRKENWQSKKEEEHSTIKATMEGKKPLSTQDIAWEVR